MNYCSSCGSKLMENAKFCSNCGCPVPTDMEQSTLAPNPEAHDNAGIAVTQISEPPYIVEFCGRKLKFEYSFKKYNDLRLDFIKHTNAARKEFEAYYSANVTDFDTLYDKGLEFFLAKSKAIIEFSISVARRHGASDVDEDLFLQCANEDNYFCSAIKYYSEAASQFIDLAEKMSSYQAARSVPRSRWQGGGFGLTGAIKGALTASALNLGTDMIRGIGNSISSSSDRAKLKKLELEFYQERDHAEGLSKALDSWGMGMWRVTEALLSHGGLLEVPSFDTSKALGPINEAVSIVHNATSSTPASEYERAIDLICQGLPYDPYFPIAAYIALYQIPQTDKKEIQKMVRFFGIEAQYNRKKIELVNDILAPILKMPESTIAQIDEKLQAIRNSHKNCPDVDIYPHIERLDAKKEELTQTKVKKAEKESSRIALQKRLQDAVEIHSKVQALNNPSGYSTLWDLAEQNIAYAQWIITVNYDPSRFAGDYYAKLRAKYANEIKERADSGSLFAQYLIAWYPFDDAFRHRVSTKPLSPVIKDSTEIIYALAKKGVIAAMSKCGLWGTQRDRAENPFIHWSEAEAVGFLKAAAKADDTQALLRLSSFYRDGLFGFPKSEALMNECEAIRDCYNTGRIRNPYSPPPTPSSSSSSNSGCFITSAVCRTFNKPDDCYELTTFRNFRDNWLAKQSDGQALIQEYYRIAPAIVELIDQRDDSKDIYQSIWDTYLTPCLHYIEAQQFTECKDTYMAMVNNLRQQYLEGE